MDEFAPDVKRAGSAAFSGIPGATADELDAFPDLTHPMNARAHEQIPLIPGCSNPHTMKRKMPFLIVAGALFCAAAFWLVSNSRAATETPDYKVIRKDGEVELRDYPALTVAKAPMDDGGMNGSFGKLFRYISGTNEQSQKIAMTSPVLIDASGEQRAMNFIVPKDIAEKGAPKPTGENVSLGKVAAARFAVMRFGGGRTAENETKAVEKLQAWLDAQSIAGKSAPMFAYYDPPWTPTFMRRNEVMIRIDPSQK